MAVRHDAWMTMQNSRTWSKARAPTLHLRQSESVKALKRAITEYPVLRQFDQTRPIYVVTDASNYAIGGCLFQYHGEPPSPCAVQYISRAMIPAELNYDVREKECLAIKYVLGKLKHYLIATKNCLLATLSHLLIKFSRSFARQDSKERYCMLFR